MPLWLSITLLVLSAIVIVYLLYRLFCNRRWIRLHAFVAIAVAYLSGPAFKLVIKAYGFDVDAVWGESSWTRDFLVAVALFLLFALEMVYQILEYKSNKRDSHNMYFHEFKSVVTDSLENDVQDTTIARNRGIPVEKVQAILICVAWLDIYTRNSGDPDGDVD